MIAPEERPLSINIAARGGLCARRHGRLFARAPGEPLALRADGSVTEIDLYDEIGEYGVSARAFRDKLKAATGDVRLRINSPGGDVFDGIAMYNDLVAHKGRVRVEVTGLAASAASIVAMAGDEIAVAENAFLMIHNAWGITIGNQHDHIEQAKVLAEVDRALAMTYSKRSGLGITDIMSMMRDETWMTGSEAKASGFATEVLTDQTTVKAAFDLSVYANAPAELRRPPQSQQQPRTLASRVELERLLHGCGLARGAAARIAKAGWLALAGTEKSDLETLADRLTAMLGELHTIRSN